MVKKIEVRIIEDEPVRPPRRLRRPEVHVHIPGPVRGALISTGVLLLLLVGAGTAYTLFMDRHSDKDLLANAKPVAAPSEPTIKAAQPAANAKEGAAVELLTSPVSVGSNASITVQTNPTSKCTIAVVYNNVASTDSGLTPKIADDYGAVSWTWTVGPSVPLGTWPVKVTCAYNGRTGFVQGDLVVTK